MNAKIEQIPTKKNYDFQKGKFENRLNKAIELRRTKDQVNQWLHIIELVSILILLAAVIVEGVFIFNLSKKEPSTALIVTEADLLNLPTVPKETLKEQ